jgi:uncharacterized repeat protein (TIGR01451 family)
LRRAGLSLEVTQVEKTLVEEREISFGILIFCSVRRILVNRSKIAMSLLLVPALALGDGSGAGCTGSTGGITPPTFNLPLTATGKQAGLVGSFTMTVSGVAAGLDISNTTYTAWCTNPAGFVPGSIVNTSTMTLFDPTGTATYNVYNSYAFSTYAAGADTGMPGPIFGKTSSLTLAQEWSLVNYVINHKTGSAGNIAATPADVQGVIWQLLHPADAVAYIGPTSGLVGNNAVLLYYDAIANGLSFLPSNGQVAAVIMAPITPQGSPKPYQGVLIPVVVNGPACTTAGSATLTKTASVSSANAFQLITYTYVVKNTGTSALSNIVVVDDNGTPNYTEDDVTVGTLATLAPGASYKFTSSVYLPVSLFYQSGVTAAFDTLITQVPSSPANSLQFTYLIDSDVSDNTYGTGASAGWSSVGGHKFSQIPGNYAEFAFYDSMGHLVSDFNADYLSNLGVSSTYPSGYGSAQLHGAPIYGGTKYIDYITSTLADNLNGYSKFYTDTTNSPVGDVNWQSTAGYKVTVDKGMFGMLPFGSVAVKKDYLNAVENAFDYFKCGVAHSASYTPQIVSSKVTGTAYLCATVCGCTTIVHAWAKTCVTVNGYGQPSCPTVSSHKCQDTVCHCTCSECQAGHHSSCSHTGCTDTNCHLAGCTHVTLQKCGSYGVVTW